MELDKYQSAAFETDQRNLRSSILGLVGETGSVISTFKKRLRDRKGFTAFDSEMRTELGDVLWYVSSISSLLGYSLDDIAADNLKKIKSLWDPGAPQDFDGKYDSDERLPKQFDVMFYEKEIGKSVYVKLRMNGITIGDRLTDNAYEDDGYRYHDVFHLAYCAVLHWSPVIRDILRCKRKSDPVIDEIQDGARARIIEEAISIHVFNYAGRHGYFVNVSRVDNGLLEIIQQLCRGLEVGSCTRRQWEQAILRGYQVFNALKENQGGLVRVDLEACRIDYIRPLTADDLHPGNQI